MTSRLTPAPDGAQTARPDPGFGPWRHDIPPDERKARCRELRALVHLMAPRSPLTAALKAAETGNADALAIALAEVERLPALPRRKILATYAALMKDDKG